jgi:rRNA maturation endonuclease Nob1
VLDHLPGRGERLRCAACGNLTVQAEEVRCRWCGSAGDVEVVPVIGEPTSAER